MHFIYWFRKDLRTTDNWALSEFLKTVSGNHSFSFLYIKNENSFSYFGEKRIRFLYECLIDLCKDLADKSFHLQILKGKSEDVIKSLIRKFGQIHLYFNEQTEPYCIFRDNRIRDIIENSGGKCSSFSDASLFNNGEVVNNEGNQFRVYTPFKNKSLQILNEKHYKKIICDFNILNYVNEKLTDNAGLDEKDFSREINEDFKGGRAEAVKKFKFFYENNLIRYKSRRDFPLIKGTSMLSAYLHFGCLSIRELVRAGLKKLRECRLEAEKAEVQTWINELLWREFYYHITFHNPNIQWESFKKEYDNLDWNYDEKLFGKWCSGNTGFPIVDAGMRQLNKEGWMHNRLRMITAMFLTKDLFIDWRAGEKYFAEKLIDMDFQNNNGGWQWSASTGVDAQPYFRIFNPYLQSKKFDPEGEFIRKYVPELRTVPHEYIHAPHTMDPDTQINCNVNIGKDYPYPMVNHESARDSALRKFKSLKEEV